MIYISSSLMGPDATTQGDEDMILAVLNRRARLDAHSGVSSPETQVFTPCSCRANEPGTLLIEKTLAHERFQSRVIGAGEIDRRAYPYKDLSPPPRGRLAPAIGPAEKLVARREQCVPAGSTLHMT
jgi:hypothetical protein